MFSNFPAGNYSRSFSSTRKGLWFIANHAIVKDFMKNVNGSQFKNTDISGAIFTLSLSILILNSRCVDGARDVKVLTPVTSKKTSKPKLEENHQKCFFMFYLQLLDKILFNNVVIIVCFFVNWKSSHPFHETFNIFRWAFVLSKFNQLEKWGEDKEIDDCNIFTSAKWFSFKTRIQISKESIGLLDSVFRCFWATETTVDLKH